MQFCKYACLDPGTILINRCIQVQMSLKSKMGDYLIKSRPVLILATLFTLVLSFQNCTSRKQFNSSSSTAQNSGGGEPYEGKIYIAVENCSDATPKAKIKYINSDRALVIKENCAILPAPASITGAEFDLHPDDATKMTYQNREFVVEPETPNPAAFGQKSEMFQSATALSVTGVPFAAPTVQGDLVICSILFNSPNGVAQVQDVSDSAGNTYRRALAPFSGARTFGVAGATGEVWYAENVSAAANLKPTAVFTESIPNYQAIYCYTYSGIEPVNALDQAVTGYIDSAPPSITLAASTTWSHELVFVTHWGGFTGLSPGFTMRTAGGDGASDQMINSAGDQNVTFTSTSGSMAGLLTFRAK